MIWASIYTGKGIAQHGIKDFYRIALPGMRSEGLFPVHRTFFAEEIEKKLRALGYVR